jgi:hypothetical protein
MGIESGVDAGLEVLHKQMTVEQNLAGVRILKELGLLFSYGFMLFDPSSTFDSVRDNVGFLRQIVGDGSAAATFCRMLPYGGTPIRDRLQAEGRLRGDVTHPDYDFLDLRLNEYYRELHRVVGPWTSDEGVSHELNWAGEELETIRRLVPGAHGVAGYRTALSALTAESNEQLFRLIEESSLAFEGGDRAPLDLAETRRITAATRQQMLEIRNRFVAGNVDALIDATRVDAIRGPVLAPQVH